MPKSDLERVIERDKYEESFPATAEARLALALALERYPKFTLPDPLRRCTRCGEHPAFYSGQDGSEEDGEFFCHRCGPRVSAFITSSMPNDDLRVIAATVALEEQEDAAPEPDTCEKCRGDIGPDEERHLIYGAVWCAACADNPDQYDDPKDMAEQRGLR